jgi:hypothetical protein
MPRELRVLTLALVVAGLLSGVPLAWFAGEHHYRNCINAAKHSHPLGRNFSAQDVSRRRDAINGCSRLPW